MAEDEEEEVTAGLLPFTVGGEVHSVPELKWRANRAWQATQEAAYLALGLVDFATPDGQRLTGDTERELVLAYDATGALGDLEDATETEISAIYDRLVKVSFPLADSPVATATAIGRMVGERLAESARANSTNGPSPTGASAAPTTLKRRSPTARSSSSTAGRKSA